MSLNLPEKLDLSPSTRAERSIRNDIHPYFAGFSSKIPHFFITALTSKGDTVLDPFCGSGTTLVEAKITNRNSVGIDANPLACLISRVKTTPIPNDILSDCPALLGLIKRNINSAYGQSNLGSFERAMPQLEVPNFKNRDYWFKSNVLKELGMIKSCISTIENRELKEFLLVAFSSIIVKVSNQQHETRYRRVDKNVQPFDTYQVFENKVREMIGYMKNFNENASDCACSVYCEDLRFSTSVCDEMVDLIVTSPPYLNAWDYNLYQRFRFYWLGFDPHKLRNSEIGAHLRHSYIQDSAQKYLEDMRECVKQMHRMLRRGGYCCIVIGEAFVKGQRIDIGQALTRIATDTGFVHQKTYAKEVFGPHFSQMRSASNKIEHTIILCKT